MRRCNCRDWHQYMPFLYFIEGMALAKKTTYTGEKFVYCPWCGSELIDDGEMYLGGLI